MTDHDETLSFQGDLYPPQDSADPAQADIRADLSVDSGGIRTHLFDPEFANEDIESGILDGAQLFHYRYDWRSGEGELLFRGRVGEVSYSGSDISIEWLGQASVLDQSSGRVFSRQCDAAFGDERCGLDSQDFPTGTTCARSFTVCRDQFNNAVNFRGFPFLLGDDVLQAGVAENDPRDGSSRYI